MDEMKSMRLADDGFPIDSADIAFSPASVATPFLD